MTLGTSPSTLKTIDQLILLAYRKAGLLPLEFDVGGTDWVQKASHAYLLLDNLIDNLAVHGYLARFVDFYDLQLTEDEQYYTLPSSILNVFDNGSYIREDEDDTKDTTGETPVEPISRSRWQQLSTKSASGTPVYYYAHRRADNVDSQIELRIWPQPDEDGTIRLQVHKFLAGNSDGNDTIDLDRHWNMYIIYALAYEIAEDSQMPEDKLGRLGRERDKHLVYAKSYSSDNEGIDIVLSHTTPWNGRRR